MGGGLQQAVHGRGGMPSVRCLFARSKPDIGIEFTLGTDEDPAVWTYQLRFGDGEQKSKKLRLPYVSQEKVFRGNSVQPVLERPNSHDRKDPERKRQTALEQISANQDFRDIAEFLATIRYSHIVPQVVRDPARAGEKEDDPFGGDFLRKINNTSPRTRNARLRRMNDALKIAVPQLSNLQLEHDAGGVPHLKANYQHWRPQGAWQRETQFSDGTLRLLGLLWALQEKGGPLLLEEPELSLNTAVVSRLPTMIRKAMRASKRQALITTHSPDMLSDPSVGLNEVHFLEPGSDGTIVKTVSDIESVRNLVNSGVPVSEAVLPLTVPGNVNLLDEFVA